jgi:hypothetical protein
MGLRQVQWWGSALYLLQGVIIASLFFVQWISAVGLTYSEFDTSTFGVLRSDLGTLLHWQIVLLQTLPVLLLFFTLLAISSWKVRWIKWLVIVLICLALLWFVASGVVWSFQLSTRNTMTSTGNPFDSTSRCCVPDVFATDPTCSNKNSPAPNCPVPLALGDLRINLIRLFQYLFQWIYVALYVVLLVFMIAFHREVDSTLAVGTNSVKRVVITETGTPAVMPIIPGSKTYSVAGVVAGEITKRK